MNIKTGDIIKYWDMDFKVFAFVGENQFCFKNDKCVLIAKIQDLEVENNYITVKKASLIK
jgi:hypothetical protein